MNLEQQKIAMIKELDARKCKYKKCTAYFKVSPHIKQKYCSRNCERSATNKSGTISSIKDAPVNICEFTHSIRSTGSIRIEEF